MFCSANIRPSHAPKRLNPATEYVMPGLPATGRNRQMVATVSVAVQLASVLS
jgi:hypothetical protein